MLRSLKSKWELDGRDGRKREGEREIVRDSEERKREKERAQHRERESRRGRKRNHLRGLFFTKFTTQDGQLPQCALNR